MKKLISILGILGILSIATVTIAITDTKVNANINASSKSQIQKLTEDSVSKNLNIEIKENNESVKLDEATAIAKAKEFIGSTYTTQASSITAELSTFSDKRFKKLPNSDTLTQNIPAWIVTFHNINVTRHGGIQKNGYSTDPTVNTDMNVVINANTGEEVEMFAYK